MRHLFRIAPVLALGIAASACVPSVAPPRVTPSPAPTPAARPLPAPAPVLKGDWRDWPLTPGDWRYQDGARESVARYGERGGETVFAIRCDKKRRQISLSRPGAAPRSLPMTIRTSSQTRTLTAQPDGREMVVTLAAQDRLLDAMGFSRGRFIVEMPPMQTLVISSWAEVLRVTEDCR